MRPAVHDYFHHPDVEYWQFHLAFNLYLNLNLDFDLNDDHDHDHDDVVHRQPPEPAADAGGQSPA